MRSRSALSRTQAWCLAAALLLPCAAHAQADPPAAPTKRELHAAQCVAALDENTRNLAREVKAGRSELKPLLQSRLEAGTAFAGDAYLHGTDEARAKQLANQALEAQKSLGEGELAARQAACSNEGAKLLEASNVLERAVVRRLAMKRMTRLLDG